MDLQMNEIDFLNYLSIESRETADKKSSLHHGDKWNIMNISNAMIMVWNSLGVSGADQSVREEGATSSFTTDEDGVEWLAETNESINTFYKL